MPFVVFGARVHSDGSCASRHDAWIESLRATLRVGEIYFVGANYGLFVEEASDYEEAQALCMSRFSDMAVSFGKVSLLYERADRAFDVLEIAFDGGNVLCAPLVSCVVRDHVLPCATTEEVAHICSFDVEPFLLPEGRVMLHVDRRVASSADELSESERGGGEMYFVSAAGKVIMMTWEEMLQAARAQNRTVRGCRCVTYGDNEEDEIALGSIRIMGSAREVAQVLPRPTRGAQDVYLIYSRALRRLVRAYVRGERYLEWQEVPMTMIEDGCVSPRVPLMVQNLLCESQERYF